MQKHFRVSVPGRGEASLRSRDEAQRAEAQKAIGGADGGYGGTCQGAGADAEREA